MAQEINVKIQEAYDTEANWKSKNSILLAGQVAYSSDKYGQYKIGDGKKTWSQLEYVPPSSHTHTATQIVSGTIPISRGGTGETTANDAANTFINALPVALAVPWDDDYYVSQYAGGGTTNPAYHRRPVNKLWEYFKTKANALYQPKGNYAQATHTHSQYVSTAHLNDIADNTSLGHAYLFRSEKEYSDAGDSYADKSAYSVGAIQHIQDELKLQISKKAPETHTHSVSQITNFPNIIAITNTQIDSLKNL